MNHHKDLVERLDKIASEIKESEAGQARGSLDSERVHAAARVLGRVPCQHSPYGGEIKGGNSGRTSNCKFCGNRITLVWLAETVTEDTEQVPA